MAPVLLVILINTATFSLIMYKLATRPPNAADPDRGTEGLLKIKRAFGILILVGITWMFGFFAVSEARLVFQYLFAIFNSLQGFAIFVFYCVIQKKVRECWWALLTCNLRSLQKSKSLYTDSYDRRRLSSASKVQLDAMRARSNTALSHVSQSFCQSFCCCCCCFVAEFLPGILCQKLACVGHASFGRAWELDKHFSHPLLAPPSTRYQDSKLPKKG